MAKIKLTLPGLEIPVDGKQVSFTAPCSCSAVDGIHIDGVDYDLVDSAGNIVPFGRFVWCEGAVLTVTLDVTNRKAYLQNQNAYTRYEALTPATAELFGLGADAVPDDVFGVLSRFQNSLGNEYVWAKTKQEYVPQYGTEALSSGYEISTSVTFPMYAVYGDAVTVNESNQFEIVNPSRIEFTSSNYKTVSLYEPLKGKYVLFSTTSNGNAATIMFQCPSSMTATLSGTTVTLKPINRLKNPTRVLDVVSYGYVNSPDPNAYPVDDGYTYAALGQFGAKVQIATGSYTGTGTYGKNNPNTLAIGFDAQVLIIGNGADNSASICVFLPKYSGKQSGWYNGGGMNFMVSGGIVSWYENTYNDAFNQLNTSGKVYPYLAIG